MLQATIIIGGQLVVFSYVTNQPVESSATSYPVESLCDNFTVIYRIDTYRPLKNKETS